MQKKTIAVGCGLRRLVLGAGLLGALTAAAATELIPIERFFQRPAVLEAKLSPSGKQLALTTAKGGTRVGLVVVDIGEGGKATRAAVFSDADIVQFDWVGDKRLVFSVVDLEAGSGEDRRYARGLYAADPDGGNLVQLVRRQGKPFVTNGDSRDRALEWNHRLLAVPLEQEGVRPEEVVVGKMDFSGNDIRSLTPMWLNVRTGRSRSGELNSPPPSAVYWLFDSKGQARLAGTRVKDKIALHWRGPGEESWRQLAEGSMLQPPFTPSAVDDAGNLYVKFKQGPEGHTVLSRFDFDKGAPLRPALVTTPGFDLSGGMVLDRAGGRALGVRVDTDGEQTIWFDEGMKRMQALADDMLPGRVNRLNCRSG